MTTVRRRPSLLVRVWLIGAVVLAGLPALPSGLAAQTQKVAELGRLPLFWPETDTDIKGFTGNGTLILNPAARRGYEVFHDGSVSTWIQAVDLDSYALIGSAQYPAPPAGGSAGAQFGDVVHAVDQEKNRVYLAYQFGGSFGGVYEIDGETLEIVRDLDRLSAFEPNVDPESPCTATSCIPTPPGFNPAIRGMSFVPAIESPASRDKLLMLLQDSTSGASGFQSLIWVAQWDVESARQDWIYRVNSCSSRRLPDDPLSRYSVGIFQAPSLPYVYLGCFAPGGTGQVVRLEQDGTSRPAAEVGFPGPLGLVDVIADKDSNRLLLKIVNDEGESYWVFDGRSTSYVGIIGTTLGPVSTGAGIDPTTGRLYVLAGRSVARNREDPGGLFMADARRSPAPQAIVFPEFATSSVFKIVVDPATDERRRRIFALPEGGDAYLVLRDGVDVSIDPPVADQDRFTTDTEEIEGVTGSNYTGTAHGYGFRSVFVGGLEGMSPSRGTLLNLGSPCLRPDREIVLGRVRRAALSNNLVGATSIASDAEAITRTDVQEPGNRCYPRGAPVISGQDALSEETIGPLLRQGDAVVGTEWPFAVTECTGDEQEQSAGRYALKDPTRLGDQAPADERPGLDLTGFSSSSSCRQQKEEVGASGLATTFTAPGLSVGQAYTSVDLGRRPGEGLRIRSESWVRGVHVEGAFSIDAARTVAEAFAAGRPGTAGTTFHREICGIRIFGEAIGTEKDLFFEGCYDPFTQVDEIDDRAVDTGIGTQTIINNQVTDRPLVFLLNRALGSRGRIRVPDPDDELKKGTPGGYLASLQKNRGEEIQARVISNDASTEVPAFEIIMFNDDQFAGRGRQLYQFAGVDASATYGIFLPPTFDFGDDFGGDAPETLPNVLVDLTGGFPTEIPTRPVAATEVLDEAQNVIARGVDLVIQSLSFFARSPREAALAAAVWFLLGLPGYLAARRRRLQARRAM